jgi:hypothetical protein
MGLVEVTIVFPVVLLLCWLKKRREIASPSFGANTGHDFVQRWGSRETTSSSKAQSLAVR